MTDYSFLSDRLAALHAELAGTGCRLVAVSKTHPNEAIQAAYDAGQRLFGENKAQEMTAKAEALPQDIEWHAIGHLQTNKVKYLAPFVSLVHAVDSPRLLQEINKRAANEDRVIPCLLQIHIAKEEAKFGFDESELLDYLQSDPLGELPNVKISGLMGMATNTENEALIRAEFKGLRYLFDRLKSDLSLTELSMGMSGDYRLALEEGSTLVRVGSAIFGQRNYPTT